MGCRTGEVRSDLVRAWRAREAGQGLTVLHLMRAGEPAGRDREKYVIDYLLAPGILQVFPLSLRPWSCFYTRVRFGRCVHFWTEINNR